MKLAYLVNQYPATSQSFIWREIAGIEASGIPVQRYSVRPWAGDVVDDVAKQEVEKTRYILGVGASGLLGHLLRVVLVRPQQFWQTLQLAVKVGRGSDRGILLHLIYLAEACVLLDWAAQAQIQHIHAHFGTNSTTVAMLCQSLGGPGYSFTAHGPEEFDKPAAIGLAEKINRSRFVVAVSSFGKSQLLRWCNYSEWTKIQVVHCGVDALFLEPHPIPFPTTPGFVCVGRLSEQKGHLLLVEAASKLAAAGYNFKLVFVGDGPLRSEIETQIQQQQLQTQIQITGWASSAQVQDFVLATQVMVLPSFAEGLPVVLMEALALGRPVISTYIAGIPELVEDGRSGWLVPAGSVSALTEAMQKALTTPVDQLQEMGARGAAVVAEHHDARIEAGKLADLFRQYL